MREARYIIVIYGMDYGLHHKGVFLILDEWGICHSDILNNTKSRKREMICTTRSFSLPCPALMHKHKQFYLHLWLKIKHFLSSLSVTNLQQNTTEISCDARLHRDSESEEAARWGGEVKRRKMGDGQGWYDTCSAKHDGAFPNITSLLVRLQLKRIKGAHCQHSRFVIVTIWSLYELLFF